MSETATECRARAAALRSNYGASPLVNVRNRYEAAAAKWDAMADQLDRTERNRAARLLPAA